MNQFSEQPDAGGRRVVRIDVSDFWYVPADELREIVLRMQPGSSGSLIIVKLFRLMADNAMGALKGARLPPRWPRDLTAEEALQRVTLLLDLADEVEGLAGPAHGAGTKAKG